MLIANVALQHDCRLHVATNSLQKPLMSAISNTGAGSLAQILNMIRRGSNGGFVACTSRPHDNVYVGSRASLSERRFAMSCFRAVRCSVRCTQTTQRDHMGTQCAAGHR